MVASVFVWLKIVSRPNSGQQKSEEKSQDNKTLFLQLWYVDMTGGFKGTVMQMI